MKLMNKKLNNSKLLKIELIFFKKKNFSNQIVLPLPSFIKNGFHIIRIKTSKDLYGLGEPSPYILNKKEFNSYFKLLSNLLLKKDLILCLNYIQELHLKKKISHDNASILSGFEQAIYDALSKEKKLPTYKILNPKTKKGLKKIKLYASGGMLYENQSFELLNKELNFIKKNKFKLFKFRPQIPYEASHYARTLNPPKVNINKLIKLCEFYRSYLGDEIEYALDLGCRLSDKKTINFFFDFCKDFKFKFIEEPFHGNKTYSKYKNNFALGEKWKTPHEYLLYKKNNFYKYFQPDSNLFGVKNIINISKKNKSRILFHNWTKDISFKSNLHLFIALGLSNYIEYNVTYNNRIGFIVKDYKIDNGLLFVDDNIGYNVNIENKNLKNNFKIISNFK